MALTQLVSTALLMSSLLGATFNSNMPDRSIDSHLFVVNKEYRLSENYSPNITTISAYNVKREIREDLFAPLENLIQVAKQDGVDLHLVSGYRSFAKQNKVFSSKAGKVGEAKAAEVVAIPGASEHQLGLAVDVSYDNWMGINQNLENTKQGKWVRTQGYAHGFVVRYLREYEDVTGYSYEPWHIRYVGDTHSQKILELGEPPLEHYVSQIRKETYEKLSKERPRWDYPVPLSQILSLYNEEPSKKQKFKNTLKIDALLVEESVWQAFGDLQADAQEQGISLELEKSQKNPYPTHLKLANSKTDAEAYLKDNAYVFGFVLEDGYYRYLGLPIAKHLYDNKIAYADFQAEWKLAYNSFLQNGGCVSSAILQENSPKTKSK